jgi:hypothetical protein
MLWTGITTVTASAGLLMENRSGLQMGMQTE